MKHFDQLMNEYFRILLDFSIWFTQLYQLTCVRLWLYVKVIVTVLVIGFSSILITVLFSNLSSGLFSADKTKSSVFISSTFLRAPFANWIKDPLEKFTGTVLLLKDFPGDCGGDTVEGIQFLCVSDAFVLWRSMAARCSGTLSSGRVKIRCFNEPSLPLGTYNRQY